jgi:sulfur-carrier protein
MAILRLFAAAREAAGTGRATVEAGTVGAVLQAATARYGQEFSAVCAQSRIWLNGELADPDTPVGENDEVAVLPPVSGGATT